MQTGDTILDKTWVAEAAITLYQMVKLGTSANEVNVCGAGEAGIGIAQNAQATVHGPVTVRIAGISKAITAGVVAKGYYAKAAAAGRIAPVAASMDLIVARALETSASGDTIDVLICGGYYATTT